MEIYSSKPSPSKQQLLICRTDARRRASAVPANNSSVTTAQGEFGGGSQVRSLARTHHPALHSRKRSRAEPHLSETGIALSFLVSGCRRALTRHANPRLHHPARHAARCSPTHANTGHRAANPNVPGVAKKAPGQCCAAAACSPHCLRRSAGAWGGLGGGGAAGGVGAQAALRHSSWIPCGAAKFLGLSGSSRRGRGESVSGNRSKQGPAGERGPARPALFPGSREASGRWGQPRPSAGSPPAAAGFGDQRASSGLPRRASRSDSSHAN